MIFKTNYFVSTVKHGGSGIIRWVHFAVSGEIVEEEYLQILQFHQKTSADQLQLG